MLHHILDSSDMFEHQSCLQHLLKLIRYTKLNYYQVECARAFRSTWQLGRTRQVVVNNGYCMNLDFFGQPTQLKDFDGQQSGTPGSPYYGITSTCEKWTQSFERFLWGRRNLEIKPYPHNIFVEKGFFDHCARSHKWRPRGSQL